MTHHVGGCCLSVGPSVKRKRLLENVRQISANIRFILSMMPGMIRCMVANKSYSSTLVKLHVANDTTSWCPPTSFERPLNYISMKDIDRMEVHYY